MMAVQRARSEYGRTGESTALLVKISHGWRTAKANIPVTCRSTRCDCTYINDISQSWQLLVCMLHRLAD